jgi:hypothetical protein
MNLEQALHQRWFDSPEMNALLRVDRVTAGRSSLDTIPRATLARTSRRVVCRTNSGDVLEEVTVEMRLRHESFDDGLATVQQFLELYDRSQFNLTDGATLLSLRRIQDDCHQATDGTWQFRVEMLARIHLPPP